MIIRNPHFLPLLALLPALILAWRLRPGRIPRVALLLRLLVVALVIMALTDPQRVQPGRAQGPLVLLVDQSESLGAEGQAALREQAQALAESYGAGARLLYFGADITRAGTPDGSETDIAAALRTAGGLAGSGGRVVLLSDGGQTRGDALAAARDLADAGVVVDTLAYQRSAEPEIWMAGVELPRTLRLGEEYEAVITVHSTTPAQAQLELFAGSQLLEGQRIQLRAGQNEFRYQGRASQAGIVQLRATLTGQPDTLPQNNSAAATALVAPPPRVLLVEDQAGGAATLSAALRPAGISAETIAARQLPAQLSALEPFDGIVLVDVPASSMSLDQMAALREFVRSEGRGLVATGGPASFTLGGYKNTPLEEVLPVAMTPPPRPERPAVTLLLIIDHSASMYGSPGASKLDMAKEAAILSTETLQDEDRLGVLIFDTSTEWTVSFTQLGSGLSIAEIQERIVRVPIGGGTNIALALQTGLDQLAHQPGEVRHAVLLTDGKATSSDRTPYRGLVEAARAQGITLSAIAIGEDADTALLQDLAQWGAGRYHFASQPQDIPRLTLLESEIARAEAQIEGDFHAELAAPHPLLRGLDPSTMPGLAGYVGTTLKPEAELVLGSPEQDPVLSVWQYGLGRAVAWTPGLQQPWAAAWPAWRDYGRFWAQVIRYTLPEPDGGPLQVRVTRGSAGVTISASAVAPSGEPVDLADTEALISMPDGRTTTVPLIQTAPGQYARDVLLPEVGPYAIEVRQRKNAAERVASAGYVQGYALEYLPVSDGARLLEQLSAATGGRTLVPGVALGDAAAPPAGASEPLWPWLLLAAVLLWPVEIAIRRGWLPLSRG